MRDEKNIENLLREIGKKIILTDYDLGVQATLKWLKGTSDPYNGRAKVESAEYTHPP